MERDLMADAVTADLSSGPINRRLAFVRWVRRTRLGRPVFGTAVALTIGLAVWPLQP